MAVSDTGIGISKEDQEKLFSKFFRAQKAQQEYVDGNGLGLYIAKRIVEEHGGTLTVTSILGKGSTFTIQLPVGESV